MNIDVKIDIWQYLKTASKPIVLYGMGNGAEKILNEFEKLSITVSGIFASDGFVREKVFRGFKIKSYSQIKAEFPEMIVIVAFGSYLDNVICNIKKIAAEQELYAVDVPVYGNTIFNLSYYNENKARFVNIYNKLCDEQSKKVFVNTILYKLTGKIDYLFECETETTEADKLLNLGENENYLDLGAYNGDTVDSFIKTVKTYNSITAVEPDYKNYKKLLKNTEELDRIECINALIGEKDGTAQFSMNSGRNSHRGEGVAVRMMSIDTLGKKNPFSFIKMDVEGNEKNAILGGRETIKTRKIKMQIACYHKSEDILELAETVLSLNPQYKLYMRHFKYIPAWDINYYFV